MPNTIYIALSRQMALRRQMDVTANNLANMNTNGFKREGVMFNEYLEEPRFNEKLAFVEDVASWRNFSNGPLKTTGGSLDMAIDGPGFFKVQGENGIRYTRNGAFTMDADRQITTLQGYPVLNENDQPIVVPEGFGMRLDVGEDGTIVDLDLEAGQNAIGRLHIVDFPDPQVLEAEGSNLFRTDIVAETSLDSRVLQGVVEQSNVSGIVEVTTMIDTARAYESTSRLLQEEHNREREMVRRLGRPAA